MKRHSEVDDGIDGKSLFPVKREWVAVTATAIKASPAYSGTLAEHEKMMVAKDTRVTAVMDVEDRGHWTIVDGVSDHAPLPEGLRFLYKDHWELQPSPVADDTAVAPVTEVEKTPFAPPVPPALAPVKPVSHRRLFALFKRNVRKVR